MKTSELKTLMKECMREVLREEGLIKGAAQVESKERKLQQRFNENMMPQRLAGKQEPEAKKKLVQEMKSRGFIHSAFDPFAGTQPLVESTTAGSPIDPPDGGVNLNSVADLLGNSNAILAALQGGKK